MLPRINNLNKNILLIAYKILHDLLFIVLIFFFLAQIAEGVLPGIVASQISLMKITFLIALNVLAIFALAYMAGIDIRDNKFGKKITVLALIIFILFIFNSLRNINLLINVVTSAVVLAMVFIVYRIIFLDNDFRLDK